MEAFLPEILEGFRLINVTKYIAGMYSLLPNLGSISHLQFNIAAMLTWVVWDHFLTIAEDVRFVRKLRHEYLGASLFLMNRYGTEAGMAFIMWGTLIISSALAYQYLNFLSAVQHKYSANVNNNSVSTIIVFSENSIVDTALDVSLQSCIISQLGQRQVIGSRCGTLFDINAFPAIIWLATENGRLLVLDIRYQR